MIVKHYRFGHTEVEIHLPEDMPIPKNMALFEVGRGGESGLKVGTKYHISFTDDIKKDMDAALSRKAGDSVIEKPKIIVFPIDDGRGECRFIRFEGTSLPYAVTVESPMGQFRAVCDRQYAELLQYDTMFNSMLALERVVMRDEAIILHSAYVGVGEGRGLCADGLLQDAGGSGRCADGLLQETGGRDLDSDGLLQGTGGRALLFSGPSGIGKSTQADLWVRYRGARIWNGDKSLLIRESDGWYAYGWPICGSSDICHNETRPIMAIVMLRQAEKNICRRMDPFRAVMEVMGQITTNTWDRQFRMKVISLAEQLIREVPVYELFCDVSEGAVECLEEAVRTDY